MFEVAKEKREGGVPQKGPNFLSISSFFSFFFFKLKIKENFAEILFQLRSAGGGSWWGPGGQGGPGGPWQGGSRVFFWGGEGFMDSWRLHE